MTDEELVNLERKHLLRGSILHAAVSLVKTAEDRPVTVEAFQRIVGKTQASLVEVQAQVNYLELSGYIATVLERRAARDEMRVVGYRPTIKGIQLVEGDSVDPAIEFKGL
jgi:hypothetical protein